MNPDKRARRQSMRIIISEILMVVAVIITVIILALIVSGYWVGSDFKLERQGMLQINSVPTGASVAVDGDAPWYQRTNTSKVLASGTHEISLTKDGYDSWSRTVNIRDGLLYRVQYPRLFLKNRTTELVASVGTASLATISPAHDTMLLINNTTLWQIYDLTSDKVTPRSYDVSKILSAVSLADDADTGLYTGTIEPASWSYDGEHLLVKSVSGDTTEWVLLNLRTPADSVNLTKTFATELTTTPSSLRIHDHSASTVLALVDSTLYRLDIPTRRATVVVPTGVTSYSNFGDNIIYTAKIPDSSTYNPAQELIPHGAIADDFRPSYFAAFTKLGSDTTTYLTSFVTPAHAYFSQFYNEKYLTIIDGANFSVYSRADYSLVASKKLDFTPDYVRIGMSGEFVLMNSGQDCATWDMEALELSTWSLDSPHFGWLDDSMLYTVLGGTLSVYDYDGQNHRNIATNVSELFPVTVTDNKWLYYFTDYHLAREKIVE